jgi:hypothetical protein
MTAVRVPSPTTAQARLHRRSINRRRAPWAVNRACEPSNRPVSAGRTQNEPMKKPDAFRAPGQSLEEPGQSTRRNYGRGTATSGRVQVP